MPRKLQTLIGLSALLLAFPTFAADAPSAHQHGAAKPAGKKPSFEASTTASATATVDSVDTKKRTVTIHTPSGELETISVGDKVKNLGQVKPGDTLDIRYHEYTRVQVYPAGAQLPESSAEAGTAQAAEGQQPAGAAGARVTLVATVEKLDKKTGQVTLKGQNGETRTVTARNKANLKNVEVGDQLVLTRERAVAASVQKPHG